MNEKTVNVTGSYEHTENEGKSQVGKKLLPIIIAAAVVLIALAVGIGIYNTPENRLQRQLDLGNKYLEEQQYEQAAIAFEEAIAIDDRCMEAYTGGIEAYLGAGDVDGAKDFYDRTLNMLDSLDADTLMANMDYAVEISLAAEKVYADDRDRIVQTLEEGYAKIGDERIQEKIAELAEQQAQEEAEKERLLAEEAAKQKELEEAKQQKELEEAERKRELEEEAARQKEIEEEEKQRELEETEGQEEVEEETEETLQTTTASNTAEAYQAKAAEYIFNKQSEKYSDWGDMFIDARWLKTPAEFYDYFNPNNPKPALYIGAMNTNLLEDTENQCRIMVTEIIYASYNVHYGFINYFEVLIDKATELGTIVDYYGDAVIIDEAEDEYNRPRGSIWWREEYNPPEWVIDFSK